MFSGHDQADEIYTKDKEKTANIHRLPKSATKSESFWYRFVGGGKFLITKDGSYIAATIPELQGLRTALESLLRDGPKDGGWKEAPAYSGRCVCADLEDEADRELPICEEYRKSGMHKGCNECGHDRGCHK